MTDATRAEVCVAACADAWRGDGEIVCSPMGTIPRLGALLARATFEPDLLLSDGEAYLQTPAGDTEGWLPFRSVFDVVASGRRHVMMGASQIDRFGNTNISAVGDWGSPKVQLLGSRGAPGNTANHATSYWIPNHSPRVFVDHVDFVSGIGYDRAAQAGPQVQRLHEIRVVVTNLAVLDFHAPDRVMRVRSVHPGVEREDVAAATGFELAGVAEAPVTRVPSLEELQLIRELDPEGNAAKEVPA